jgi:hypothetical protein
MTPILDFKASPSVVLSREEPVVECDHEGWLESDDAFTTCKVIASGAHAVILDTIGARLSMTAASH